MGRRRKWRPNIGMRNIAALACFIVACVTLAAVPRLVCREVGTASAVNLDRSTRITLTRKTMFTRRMAMTGTVRNRLVSPKEYQQPSDDSKIKA